MEDRISKLEENNDPQLIADHLQEDINHEVEKRKTTNVTITGPGFDTFLKNQYPGATF